MLKQVLLVLREGGGVEGRSFDVQIEEPLEEKAAAQPLAELALTAYRIKGGQQAPLEAAQSESTAALYANTSR